jgi:hypothetical protein
VSLEPLTTVLAATQRRVLAATESRQRRLLATILRNAASGAPARQLGLTGWETFEEFLQLAPRNFAFYRPFVERTLAGDRHTFGRDEIVALAETSGSSGEPKLIPHTAASLATIHRFAKRVLLFQMLEGAHYIPHFTKWMLVTASTTVRHDRGIPVGFISGLMYEIAQRQRRDFILPSPPVAALTDWRERIDRSVEEAWRKPIGTLIGVPMYLERFLEAAAARANGEPLGHIWPRLGRVCYSGTSLANPERLEEWLGRKLIVRGLYSATEGSFAAELEPRFPGQLQLMVDLVVFTFRDATSPTSPLLAAWQLERGRTYEIFITTRSGLLQYELGDLIEVAETRPLRIRVAGRAAEEINLATEKLSAVQARLALGRIARLVAVEPERFVVVRDPANARRHLWIVEGDAAGDGAAQALDRELGAINPSYAALRDGDAVLERPRVAIVPRGSFDTYIAEGLARRGQFKFRHVWSDDKTLVGVPGMRFIQDHAS